MKRKIQFKSIKPRLTLWFLIMALLPLITVCIINHEMGVNFSKVREGDKLVAIRDLMAQQVNSWLDHRMGDIRDISEDDCIREIGKLPDAGDRRNDLAFDHARENLIRFIKNSPNFLDLFIINPHSGRVEISTDRLLEGENRSDRLYFTTPLQTGQVYIETYYSKYLDKPSMTFSIPIYSMADRGQHLIGILAGRINLEDSLYDMLLDRAGMGETGETLIIGKDGIVLNELRWDAKAPFKLKVDGGVAGRALREETGIAEAIDYRGEKVLAAYTFIPRTQWGFVAKQDLREIYAPTKLILRYTLILLLISVIATYLVTSLLTRTITRPIVEMTQVSKRIEQGELSARNRTERADELGYLARSFNTMADSVMSNMAIQEGGADIVRVMVSAEHLADFGEELLKKLVEITGSHSGAFYLLNEDGSTFEHLTSIGVTPQLQEPFDAEKKDGEFGRVLATQKISRLTHIPPDTAFTFKTFMGTVLPREIITIPLIVRGRVMAVISLAALNDYSRESLEILNQIWMIMGTAFSNQLANAQTQKLAEELRSKNEQLQMQTEELQTQAEELQQQAEELQQQSEELLEQNAELEAQRSHVEEANRLKSAFMSNMSHELRTPLNSIMALSHVLLMQARQKLSQEEGKYLEIIERNGRGLLALINDILDLSKIESGRFDINPKPLSLASIIEIIIERLEPLAREKGIEIKVDIPEYLPSIVSSEERVHQILQNIMGNAVKFTERGSITVSVCHDTQKVYIKIADTGIGIANEDLPYIFKEFRQVDSSSSRRYGGTGLGLAIAFKAARLLGGKISVESELGKGTIFTLTLPIEWPTAVQVYETASAAMPPTEIQPAGGPVIEQDTLKIWEAREWEVRDQDGRSRQVSASKVRAVSRILLVEDSQPAIIQVKAVLENEGYHVDVALSGEEALFAVQRKIPDGIILDLMMPEIDGFTVLEKIRSTKATAKIPVLILTAKDLTQDDFKKLTANHVQQLVQKGNVDKEGLLLKVKLMLGGKRGGEEVKKRELPETKISKMKLPKTKLPETNLQTNLSKMKKGNPVILVIEDNPDNMVTIKSILKDKYKILEAADGEAGLNMALTQLPDLVFLDMALPKMDGYMVVQKMKADKRVCHIPVIALTALAMKGDREKILEAGCDDYISKPIDPEYIMQRISEWAA
jgi:signal transduction histidine kinase/CheY-like chemotaxis protein/HAMP domain-containing protein